MGRRAGIKRAGVTSVVKPPKRGRPTGVPLTDREAVFKDLLLSSMDDSIYKSDREFLVTSLCEKWNPTTKRNYLQKFTLFLEFVRGLGLTLGK